MRSHWPQWYLVPSCWNTLCNFRRPAVVAAYSPRLQGYINSSCFTSLFCLRIRGIVLALITRVSYSFVFCFLVLLETARLSSNVFTLVARVSYTFDFAFLRLFKDEASIAENSHWSQGCRIVRRNSVFLKLQKTTPILNSNFLRYLQKEN